MQLKILIGGDEVDQDLSSLYQWLTRDPTLKRVAEITAAGPTTPSSDAMGIDADSLNAIVGNLLGAGSLIVSILAWKDSHAKSPTVHIEHGAATAAVEGHSADAVQSILVALDEPAPTSNNVDPG
jgi:hypothetical protein